MSEKIQPNCPDCESTEADLLHRRGFVRSASERVAGAVILGSAVGSQALGAPAAKKKAPKPAEEMIRELFSTLSDEQKKLLVLPWDHGGKGRNSIPTRLGMYNGPIMGRTISKNYSGKQQELLQRILRSISSDEEGYKCITRNGTFDNSRSFGNCGALIFGDPSGKEKFSWVFTGHHLTVRCDGNSEEGAAFGGPMYYGHSPNGYSARNVFSYQTKQVMSVHEALDEKQRKKALVMGSPGERAKSVQFRPEENLRGIGIDELSDDQQSLVAKVMRSVLSPFRKEDGDEVMEIIKKNGGMKKIHLAFYHDTGKVKKDQPWSFWRLEGPGFVWNFRVLPHVHTFVNISSSI